MKQMNALENQLDLKLIERTPLGVHITPAGEVIYRDAKFMIDYSKKSIAAANAATHKYDTTFCVGTSLLNPAKPFMDLWYKVNQSFLDWLFVFPLQMGVMGAAVATGISQTIGLLVALTHYVFKKGSLRIQKYKPQMKLFRKIAFRGLPEAIAQFSTPVTTLCMNYTLMAAYGDIGINAFAIISYLSSFTMAVFFGASEGMQPLFGQAYGAKEDDNLKHYYHAGQLISVIGSALCVAIYVIFPHFLCQLFGANAQTLEFTATHMWEYCWGFIVGSVNSMLSAYFYSTKRSGQAIALNVVRSLIMNSLIITFLPKLFGSAVVWHTFGIYEVLVLVTAVVMKKDSERKGIIYR